MKKICLLSLILILTFGPLATQSIAQEKKEFEVSKNFDILHALYRELDQFYVDSMKSEKVLRKAIDGLMEAYDPYTNYIAEAETDELKFITTGEYGGVGAVIGQRNGQVMVLEPYQGLPAQKGGLTYGDILLEIGGVKMSGANRNKASDLLRGQPGTTVNVVFTRTGVKKPIEKTLTRELVQIKQVVWHGLVANKVGYINLTGFTTKSSQEVHEALLDLKAQGAEKLVLDLRGNGGGLLDEAVSICNLFVPKGREVVSTRGKMSQWDKVYKTTQEPVDTIMPLVVLVNNSSASSSEILAGSLQDLDRAVILGTRTFGKGLVQTTRNIPYNGVLKVTTAKYYIPSGRCIQAINYAARNDDGSVARIPDSLTHVFRTRSGREVRDGGGIVPDVQCPDRKGADFCMDMLDSLYFFEYANTYCRLHDKIAPVKDFKVTDADVNDFLAFVKGKDFKFNSGSKKVLELLRQSVQKDGLDKQLGADLDSLERKLTLNLDEAFQTYREDVELMLGMEIVSRYYYQAGELEQSLKFDPCLRQALELLSSPEKYAKTLKP
jgi:carboxyl-terminal processing protease